MARQVSRYIPQEFESTPVWQALDSSELNDALEEVKPAGMCIYVCVYACVRVVFCMCAYVSMCVCVSCASLRVRMCVCEYNIYIYIYIYIYICLLSV